MSVGPNKIDIWPQFMANISFPNQFPVNVSVASEAVRSIGLTTGVDIGGSLGALDIKRMDVKTAISMSLMEHYVRTGELYELVADEYGGVKFIRLGDGAAGLGRYYYTTQTMSFNADIKDVLVTGGKPLPEIKLGEWYDVLQDKEIYTAQTMFENCRLRDFYKYATIVYKDPHLDTQYRDGIDNLYNIENPFERLIGYIHYKNPNLQNRPDVKINWANESSIPIRLHDIQTDGGVDAPPQINMGILQEIKNVDVLLDGGADIRTCIGGLGDTVSYVDGVKVNIPDKWRYETIRGVVVDNFIRISAVYVIGLPIDLLFFAPSSYEYIDKKPTRENSILWASINKVQLTTFKCEEGRHYAIAFDEEKNPYVVFGKETRNGDPFPYGANTTFRLDPICNFARKFPSKSGLEITGTVFPITKTEGVLVFDIWVVADVEVPCVVIYDPEGQAHRIAENFEYYVRPLSIIDKPPPIASAIDGLLDQESAVRNADPTDMQNFQDTPLEKVLDRMHGYGFSVSWSFLEEQDVASAATRLYALLRNQNEVVETIYTCGPEATPQLGASIHGGYVNAIRYAYNDQGSYTISVTVGPMLTSSSIVQVDGGPAALMVEDISARGVIIQSAGDNINFKVRIDGYGERWAVCMTPQILRVGDVVQCSVHNNPIEY